MFNPTENLEEYYSTLELQVGAAQDEIKKSYRKLSLRYHPDTVTENVPDASEKFMRITQAYQALLHQDETLTSGNTIPAVKQ